MSFILAHFTHNSTELMSAAKSREWMHHNFNQPTNKPTMGTLILNNIRFL